MKNASKPPSSVANKACASACDSKASGKACSKEVDSKMPTDRLTMRSTMLDNSEKENSAAAVMLTTPAIVVASRMEISVELISHLWKMRRAGFLPHAAAGRSAANKVAN